MDHCLWDFVCLFAAKVPTVVAGRARKGGEDVGSGGVANLAGGASPSLFRIPD